MVSRFLPTLFGQPAAAFGDQLAVRLAERFPRNLDMAGKARISANRIANILESLYNEAQFFRKDQKLGLIGRTRLTHAFKWRLIELGYSKAFIDMATEGLVVYMHRPPAPVAPETEQAREKRARKAEKRTAMQSAADAFSRANPSPRYVELVRLYREMHENGEKFLRIRPEDTFPGLSLPIQAPRIRALIEQTGALRLLDYGSGKGQQYQARNLAVPGEPGTWPSIQDYWGVEAITCYDPSYAPLSELPRGAFDGVISTDVLEHCPEEDIPWIIDEIFGYARKFVFMNVACYPAKKRLPTGENAHCTIRPKEWWVDIIQRVARKHSGIRYEVWIQRKDADALTEEVIRG
jgi:hypothetical protein